MKEQEKKKKRWSTRSAWIFGKDRDGFPIVGAWRIGRTLFFRCPWCGRIHGHGCCDNDRFGFADGHRIAHCWPPRDPAAERGYIVREVREMKQAGDLPAYLKKRKGEEL